MTRKWWKLFVKAPKGNGYTTPQAMKRVDDHLVRMTYSFFVTDNDLPVQGADGTWEVLVYMEKNLDLAKKILTKHYGLEIVREVENFQ